MKQDKATAAVLKTNPGTSIQDLGRPGAANFGVPTSGAMDKRSMLSVNHLLQNHQDAAVLEISQPGFAIQFDSPTVISLAGAIAEVKLNATLVTNPSLLPIEGGDTLEIGRFAQGARVYLGIKDGFQSDTFLGSRSFYTGITESHQLSKGNRIPYLQKDIFLPQRNAKPKWRCDWFVGEQVNAYPGPDFHLLGKELRHRLTFETFSISPLADRMGIQLSETLENNLPELPTNPIFPGMVQLTSGGKLIILLRDAQVTGGYPRILFLDEESQCILAQKRSGDRIRFNLIDPELRLNMSQFV